MGAGAIRGLSAVRWGVAGNIVGRVGDDDPVAGAVGALMELVTRLPAGDAIVFALAAAIACDGVLGAALADAAARHAAPACDRALVAAGELAARSAPSEGASRASTLSDEHERDQDERRGPAERLLARVGDSEYAKIATGSVGSASVTSALIAFAVIDDVKRSGAVSPATRATASTVPVRMPPIAVGSTTPHDRPPRG